MYVNVPQRQVAQVRPGAVAQITVPERPGRTYAAKVQSLSQSISTGSGAMLVQLAVDNAAGELLPGGFASVRFDAQAEAAGLSVPPGALIFGKNGVQVATLDKADRVQLKQVTIARDLGSSVELATGLGKDDRVIQNPPDGVSNGDQVRVASADNKKKAAP